MIWSVSLLWVLQLLAAATTSTAAFELQKLPKESVAILRGSELAKFRHNQTAESTGKRTARWTFQNLSEDSPVNGSEILQYEPVTDDQQISSRPDDQDPSQLPSMDNYRPDKVLKSTNDAVVVMNQLANLKKDFCKTEKIVQRIKEDGCIGRNVINRYCYGQCNSFYIPEGPKRRRGRHHHHRRNKMANPEYLDDEDLTVPQMQTCPSCRPNKVGWVTITLRCPKLSPPTRKKRIQKIRQCKCMEESATAVLTN